MPNLPLSLILSAPTTAPGRSSTGPCRPDAIDLMVTTAHPSEIFWRQLKFQEFDVSEMSMSSLLIVRRAASPVGGAADLHPRQFFHTAILVRANAGIESRPI